MQAKTNRTKKKQGMAALPREEQERLREKSLRTRRRNAELRRKNEKLAKEKRDKANELLEQAEILQQEADELDGQSSSEKKKKELKGKLKEELIELHGDSLSPQFLKVLVDYAAKNNIAAEDVQTPSHAALDIIHDPRSSVKEKENAYKTLAPFENAKPMAREDEGADVVGSIESEMEKLMEKMEMASPKG